MRSKIVICIPTELESRQKIASALLNKYGTDYLFLGRNFRHTATNQSCEIQICTRPCNDYLEQSNLDLAKAIELAGQDKISDVTLNKISRHQQLVYLISHRVGYDACRVMARFVGVFLNIGGIAVNVESAQIAYEADRWLDRANSSDVFDTYCLFVGLVEAEDIYYSVGMHNFGKADVAIAITTDIGLAIYVMNVFNYYRLTESPILQDGHTFQPDIESPKFTMKLIEDNEYPIDSFQFNPYGRWMLTRC